MPAAAIRSSSGSSRPVKGVAMAITAFEPSSRHSSICWRDPAFPMSSTTSSGTSGSDSMLGYQPASGSSTERLMK